MKFHLALATCMLAAATTLAVATQHKHGAAAPAAPGVAAAMADGEVRRIDAAKASVLLKHGPIPSINMGAMTMGFRLKAPALAAGLKVGDKVRFAAEQEDGELIVTQTQKVD
jgi:Cu/Ag efflux protein CusF